MMSPPARAFGQGEVEMGGVPSETPYTIPYEKQFNAQSSRTCGAACLSMVYKSLGKEVPQEEIWAGIAKVNRFGSLASTTHLMVSDALKRGFDAVAIKARHPIFALQCLRDTNIRVILNHRLGPDLPTGHYSVLVDVGQRDVTLHDPYSGPSRRITHGELMQLWEPGANSEIAGETLIAISAREETPAACEICQTPIPATVACPQCGRPVWLRPATGIGCVGEACVVRRWLSVCCPSCDYMWNFTAATPAPAVSPPQKEETQDAAAEINTAFAKIDSLCAQLAVLPIAAGNAQALKYIDALKGLRGKVLDAVAEYDQKHQAHMAKLEEQLQKGNAKKAAQEQKMAEINTPPPPLDGNALAQALLKNMGLIRRTGLTEIMKIPG
jgi:hypothetical protein